MKGKAFIILCAFTILSLFMATGVAYGQAPEPSATPESPPSPNSIENLDPLAPVGAEHLPNGLWLLKQPGLTVENAIGALATPVVTDTFGYVKRGATYSWVDALNGMILNIPTDSPLSIGLPFTFHFYENSYDNVLVSKHGYLSFTDGQDWLLQSPVKDSRQPNNLIAPYWAPLQLNPSGQDARIYIRTGGSSPNRYVVVEWYKVQSLDQDSFFTFEVVLYENGSILFQYQTMNYVNPVWCPSAGIEDSAGTTGIISLDFCKPQASRQAVRFTRPGPTVGMELGNTYYGAFAAPGTDAVFHVTVRNTGQMGNDAYELTYKSKWAVKLYQQDGTTLLKDTNHNNRVDTGPVAEGSAAEIVVKVSTPAGADTGASNKMTMTVTSRLNSHKKTVLTLQSAVPAAFAQAFYNDRDRKMDLLLVDPTQSMMLSVPDGVDGSLPALAANSSGNLLYLWTKRRCAGSSCAVAVNEIEAVQLDHNGVVQRAVTRLFDLSGATVNTEDRTPSVAMAQNGSTGLAWIRRLVDVYGRENYNVFFAVLDSGGHITYGPVDLTGNQEWYSQGGSAPVLSQLRIAPSGTDRFVMTWQKETKQSNGKVDDVIYTIRNSSGTVITPVSRLTNDTPGKNGFTAPVVTGLRSGRVMIAYSTSNGIRYTIMNSDGSIYKMDSDIKTTTGTSLAAAELSTGKVLLAWTGMSKGRSRITYAFLNNGTYNRLGRINTLDAAASTTGGDYVSVAVDDTGRGILTWMDGSLGSHKYLYYGLVGANGSLETPAMVLLSQADGTIWSASDGQGCSSYIAP